MPVHKRVPVTAPSKTYKSGTHAIGGRPARTDRVDPRAEPEPASRDSVDASPEIEIESTEGAECGANVPGTNIHATVEAVCDGCGVVVEVELSRFLESSAVACSGCLDAVVKGWGKALDRPTIEWMPSKALLCASRPPTPKTS